MIRRSLRTALLALLAVAASAAGGVSGRPAGPEPIPATAPSLAERLAWNPWERTRTGIDRLRKGDAQAAAAALDRAFRLRADDPRAAFNAGTGRLAAGRPDAAAPLEQAALAAGGELAPDAWYNLGNARLAGGDARGAVAAYQETLRRASDRQDAKRNLELALRELDRQQKQERQELEQQQPQQKDPRQQSQQGRDEEQQSGSGQEGSSREPGDPPPAGQRSPGEPPQPGQPGAPDQAATPRADRSQKLPEFENQPDLDAEQAAALLQAVENLERQQRREHALERARARRSEDEDW